MSIRKGTLFIAGVGILTAVVVVLQYLTAWLHAGGLFSLTFALVPIIVGGALYGVGAGAWLGLAFGVAVLLSGDASLFLQINPVGTIATVLVKGAAAGAEAALVYKAASVTWKNPYPGVVFSSILCPVTNTGVFLIGCMLFFVDTIKEWAGAGVNVGVFVVTGLIGWNFLIELGVCLVLCPVIYRIIQIGRNYIGSRTPDSGKSAGF